MLNYIEHPVERRLVDANRSSAADTIRDKYLELYSLTWAFIGLG